MDALDTKLIAALDAQPTIALTTLAKQLRVSQQRLEYRLRRLQEEKIITKIAAVPNLNALGLEHYRLFFTFHNKHNHTLSSVLAYLRTRPEVYWAARIGGKYDLHVTVFVADFQELDDFLDTLSTTFPGLIRDYEGCYGLEHFLYNHKQLGSEKQQITYGCKNQRITTDAIDQHILKELSKDCRQSSIALASGCDVTYKTILNRIKELEKKKILAGYRLFMKSKEHAPYILLMTYKEYTRAAERKLLAYMHEHTAVTQTIRLFGKWNLLIHVRAENYETVQQCIIGARDESPILDNFEIMPVFEDIIINLMPQTTKKEKKK